MKYIESYRNQKKPNFKVGDIVICIDNTDYSKLLTLNDYYIIMDLHKQENMYYVNVINIKTGQEVTDIFANRFINKYDYTINKYNL